MQVLHFPAAAPVKAWTDGVPVEDVALQQVANVARLPFIFHHVALMPDVHWGLGATVGSVIATKGAIIPAAVGVDIGCGMIAARTNLTASDLPDKLHRLRSAIEHAVPHGRTDHRCELFTYRLLLVFPTQLVTDDPGTILRRIDRIEKLVAASGDRRRMPKWLQSRTDQGRNQDFSVPDLSLPRHRLCDLDPR